MSGAFTNIMSNECDVMTMVVCEIQITSF